VLGLLLVAARAAADPVLGPDRTLDPPVVTGAPGDQTQPAIAFGAGLYLNVWSDGGKAIRGVRLDPSGAILDAIPIAIQDAGTTAASPSVAFDGQRFVVTWEDQPPGGNWRVLAVYVDASGIVDSPIVVAGVAGATQYDAYAPVVAAGNGHALLAWQQATSVNLALYDDTGTALVANQQVAASSPVEPAVAWASGAGSFLLAWVLSATGIMVAQVDFAGNVGTPFRVDDPTLNYAQWPVVASDGTDFLVAWSNQMYAFARLVPAVGAPTSAPFTASPADTAMVPQLGFIGGDYVLAWNTTDYGSPILATRITPTGTILDGNPVTLCNNMTAALAGSSRRNQFATAGATGFLTFVDLGTTLSGNDTIVMPVDPTRFAARPLEVTSLGSNIEYPRTVASNGDVFLIAWTDNRNAGTSGLDILGMRVGADGSELDAQPFVLCNAAGDQFEPMAAAAPGGDFLVVFTDGNAVRGTRVPPIGPPLDGAGFMIGGTNSVAPASAVAAAPDGWLVAFASTDIYGDADVASALVSSDAKVGPVHVISFGAGCAPAAAWNGTRYIVAYESPCAEGVFNNTPTSGDVYARWVAADGVVQAGTVTLAASPTANERQPAVAAANGSVIATWSVDASAIVAALLPDGNGAPATVQQLTADRGDREAPQVTFSGDALFTWIDTNPIGVRALRTDGNLAALGTPFMLASALPFRAPPPASGTTPPYEGTPPPAVATLSSGAALVAYDLIDTVGSESVPRIHYRTLGVRAPGAPCVDVGDCASGLCTGGVCCSEPCDGVCEACSARGCVETPASDPRCGAAFSCPSLSTDCRVYDDAAGRCAAFNLCAQPSAADCTVFTDAPDGSPCHSGSLAGRADGVCRAGSCAPSDEPVAPEVGRSPPDCSCQLHGGTQPGGALLVLLLVLLAWRRRAAVLLVLLVAAPAFAEVVGKDQSVDAPVLGGQPGDQQQTAIAFGAGEFFQVWKDPDGSASAIRGVRFLPDGTFLDTAPIQIYEEASNAEVPAVGFDGKRFLVAWDTQNTVFVAWVDPLTGNVESTTILASANGYQPQVAAVSAGDGFALVVWGDYPSQIEGALFDDTGARIGGPLIFASLPNGSTFTVDSPAAAWSGPTSRRFLVAWAQPYEQHIMAAQLDVDGTIATPFEIDDPATLYAYNPTVATDGSNFLVAWQADIGNYYPQIAGRLVPVGGPPTTGSFSIALETQTNFQDPQALFVDGNYFLAWVNATTRKGLLGARVSPAGAPLDGAVGVLLGSGPGAGLPDNSRRSVIATPDGKSAWIAFTRYQSSVSGVDTFALSVDPNQLGGETPLLTSRGINLEYSRSIATDGKVFLIVWSDDRNVSTTGADVLGIRLGAGGEPLDAQPFYICRAPGDQLEPAVAAAPGGDFLVAWSDNRSGASNIYGTFNDLYGARVPASGPPRDPDGFPIHPPSTANSNRRLPSVAAGAAGWLVAWQDYRAQDIRFNPVPEIWSTLVTAGGSVGDEQAIALSNGGNWPQCAPAATWNGARFFVAFEQSCGVNGTYQPADVFGRWVGPDGVPEAGAVPLGTDPQQVERQPSVSTGAGGIVVAAWNRADAVVSAALVPDEATEPQVVVQLYDQRGNREAPQVAYAPSSPSSGDLLFTWIDSNPLSVRAVRTDAQLQQLAAPFSLVAGAVLRVPAGSKGTLLTTPAPAAAALPSGEAISAYDFLETVGSDSYSRVHFATVGLRSPGEPCATQADCADGICTGGVCCATACDGVCEACSARGCVETPAADARCGAGELPCSALSTDCRRFDDVPPRCAAFNQCAPPAGLAACTQLTDAPDGTPCSSVALGAAPDGECRAGSCVMVNEPVAPVANRGTPGCQLSGAAPHASGVWILLALVACARRRRRVVAAILALALARTSSATPRLGPDSVTDAPVVSGTPGDQSSTAIAYGAGEYLQVWRDPGPVNNGASALRAVRLLPDGTVLDSVPIVIEDAGTNVYVPAVGFDGQRFLVAWQENMVGYGQVSIYAAYVDALGNPDTPQLLDSPQHTSILPAVAGGDGHAMVVWIGNQQAVRFALFDASGAQVGANVDLATSATLGQFYQPAVEWSPGAQRFLVAYGAGTNPYKVMASQVDPTGAFTTPFQVSSTLNDQNPIVASDGNDFLVAWSDPRSGTSVDIYGRLVPASGTPASADFLIGAVAMNNLDQPQATFAGGNYLVVWPENANPTMGQIGGERVSPSGALLDATPFVLLQGPGTVQLPTQSRRKVLASDGTQAFFAYARLLSSATGMETFAAPIDPANLAAPFAPVLTSRGDNSESAPAIASNGALFLLAWRDNRNLATTGDDILGLRVGADGTPLDAEPFYICQANGDQERPSVAATGGGDFLVVWEDGRGPRSEIYGSRVPSTGPPRDPDGFLIHPPSVQEARGRVAPAVAAKPDGWLVAWIDLRSYDPGGGGPSGELARPEIWSTVLAPDGSVGGEQVVALPGCAPAVAWDGTRFMVAFENPCSRGNFTTGITSDVYGRWVEASGAISFDEVPLGTDPTVSETAPQLSAGPDGVIAVWATSAGDIWGAPVADGAAMAQALVQLFSGRGTRESPSVAFARASATTGDVLVSWIDDETLGVRGLLADATLAVVDGPFAIAKHPPVRGLSDDPNTLFDTAGTIYLHSLGETSPAPVAVESSGGALASYDLLDVGGTSSYPRLHYRTVGLRGPGEPCVQGSDCAAGSCTGGICCAVACDGVCQACSALGCVVTPASDARCAGASGCAALSTDCRVYDDAPAGRCEAFGRCAPPGSAAECTSWLDAPDGTPCRSSALGGAPDGVCQAGSCALGREPVAPVENRPAAGCSLAAAPRAPSAWLLLALFALALRRRRALALLALLVPAPAAADFQLGADRPVDAPVTAAAFNAQGYGTIAYGAGEYLLAWLDQGNARAARMRPDGTLLDDPPLFIAANAADLAVSFDGTRFVALYQPGSAVQAVFIDPTGVPSAPITVYTGNASNLTGAAGGGRTLLAWTEQMPNYSRVRGAFLDGDGTVHSSVDLTSGTYDKSPFVQWGGSSANAFLLVYLNNAQVWAERIALAGTQEAPWRVNDGTLDPYEVFWPSAATTGNEYLVSWTDDRNFYAGTTNGPEVYGRIVPFTGAPAATDFAIAPYPTNSMAPGGYGNSIGQAIGVDGEYLVFWGDVSFLPRVSRVTSAGALLDPLGVSSVRVDSFPRAQLASDGKLVMATSFDANAIDPFTVSDVYAVAVDPATLMAAPSTLLSRGKNYQLARSLASNGNVFLLVWDDDRNRNQDIYGMRFAADGTPLDAQPIVICDDPSAQFQPVVAGVPGGDFLVAWSDARATATIFVNRVGASGPPRDGNGFAVHHPGTAATAPTVAAGASGWLVAWEDWRLGINNLEVWSAPVASDGTVATERRVASGADSTRQACAPAAIWNGQRWFVAFEQPCSIAATTSGANAVSADIYGRWLDPTGLPRPGTAVPLAITQVDDERAPALASDGAGEIWAAWTTGAAVLAATLGDLAAAPSASVAVASSKGSYREAPALAYVGGDSPELAFSWISHSPLGVIAQRTDRALAPIGGAFVLSSAAPLLAPKTQPYFGAYWRGWSRTTEPAPLAASASGGALAAYSVMESLAGVPTPRAHVRAFGTRPRGAACAAASECADGFCASGVCCDVACDGICQACTADGCVATPPADARCGAALACAALSTSCRSYTDVAGQCAAFNRCAAPGGLGECTQFSDAPDGKPCALPDGTAGSCASGQCAGGASDGGSIVRVAPGGCSLGGTAPPPAIALVLIALLALVRRRAGWLVLLVAGTARAGGLVDLPADAPVVIPAPGQHTEASLAFGAGEYLVVYADKGSTIRGARLSTDGKLLDAASIVIGDEGGTVDTPSVAFDGKRFLVAWILGTGERAAYVDSSGYADAPFAVVDPRLYPSITIYHPVVAAGAGRALVAWAASNGVFAALYDQDGVSIGQFALSATNVIAHPGVGFAPATRSFLAAWGEGNPLTIMSAQIDSTGTLSPSVRLDAPPMPNPNGAYNPSVASDGSNFLVAWTDQRSSPTPSLYGRFVPAGGIPAANEIPLAMNQLSPKLTYAAGNYLLLWTGVGAERISSSGALLDGAGVTIGPGAFDQTWSGSAVATDGTHALAVVDGVTAYAIDPANLQPATPILVTPGENSELAPALASNGKVSLLVWSDNRPGSALQALRFAADGTPVDAAPFALPASGGGVQPSLAAAPNGDFLVAWSDGWANIWGTRVPTSGPPRDATGLTIAHDSEYGGLFAPTVAASPGGWLVAWEDYSGFVDNSGDFTSVILSAVVGLDGTVGGPGMLASDQASCSPAAIWDGTHYFVAFEDPCGAEGTPLLHQVIASGDLYGRWLEADGSGGVDSVPISVNPFDSERMPRLALGPSGSVIVVWESNLTSIGAALLTDGATAPAIATTIFDDRPARSAPAVTFSGSSGLVTWVDQNPAALRAARIDGSLDVVGAPFQLSAHVPWVAPYYQLGWHQFVWSKRETPAVAAASPSGAALVAMNVLDDGNYPRIRTLPLGLRAAGEPCESVADCASGICTGGVCCAVACEGVCEACSARGCVETPASDARCGSGATACSALSTDCRSYQDVPGRCAAFNLCAPAAGLDGCTQFTDAPDGTPCSSGSLGGAADGVCRAGSCALVAEPLASSAGRSTPGCACEVGGAANAPWPLLALVAGWLSARDRRRGRPCASRRRPPPRRDSRRS
jgi:hypothetical protein